MRSLMIGALLFCVSLAAADDNKSVGKHLFILSGQSNMQGHRPNEAFTPAVEEAFGKQNVIVVQDALGGQPIKRWYRDWAAPDGVKPETTGDLYDRLMTKVKEAIANQELTTVTFFWMQGERDARMKWGAVYEKSLLGLHQQLSKDLARDDIGFVIGRLSDFDMQNQRYPHWTMVREAQVKVAKSNARFDWIDTDDLNDGKNRRGKDIANDLHYSAEGYKTFGRRMAAAAIKQIQNSGKRIAVSVDPSQAAWYEKYKKQVNVPLPQDMLLNTDAEPGLDEGFQSLFNGQDLKGWTAKGGTCKFTVQDDCILGECVPGSESTYLCTDKADYTDFVFTCDMKWEIDGNSGVMFRARVKETKKNPVTVYGPQVEMEGFSKDRGWSGGVYGQSCGGYFYPVWLTEHKAARSALKKDAWNRVTVLAQGNVVKTWVNGVPVAHWIDDGSYPDGFFGLQIHKGKAGKVLWKDLRVKQLP